MAVLRRFPSKGLLDRVKASLKKHLGLVTRKGRPKPTHRFIDGEVLARQEVANVTAAREQEEREFGSEWVFSSNESSAGINLDWLANTDETRDRWWDHLDDPCYHWPTGPEPRSPTPSGPSTQVDLHNPNGLYDAITKPLPSRFLTTDSHIHRHGSPDPWYLE
ncbi:hypothetical protein MMC07_001318 [Pseudocyphellaria aurata]|nr:hypothetical protein [Pseudocyphellaria aurata]